MENAECRIESVGLCCKKEGALFNFIMKRQAKRGTTKPWKHLRSIIDRVYEGYAFEVPDFKLAKPASNWQNPHDEH